MVELGRVLSLMMILAVLFTTPLQLPGQSNATDCRIHIDRIEYPNFVDLGQAFEVKTHLSVGCSVSRIDLSGRVDLIEQDSHKTVSISGLQFTYVNELGKPFNLTVVNGAQAPPSEKNWKLKVSAMISAGGITAFSAEEPFSIQVGSGDMTLVWFMIIVATAVVASIIYSTRMKRQKSKPRKQYR